MKYVVDTHALVWFLSGSARLDTTARMVLADPNSQRILPATALAEACWLVEHGKTSIPSVAALLAAVDADRRLALHPLDRTVIDRTTGLAVIGEMHDRQIVATALVLIERGESVSLVPYDANITASGFVPVVW